MAGITHELSPVSITFDSNCACGADKKLLFIDFKFKWKIMEKSKSANNVVHERISESIREIERKE